MINELLSRRQSIEAWLSLVERYIRDVEVAGSNPVASIQKKRRIDFRLFFISV